GSRKLMGLHLGELVALQASAGAPTTYATISGFVMSPATLNASLLDQVNAYMPGHAVRKILGQSYDNFLLARVADANQGSTTATQIQNILARRGISSSNYVVRNPTIFTGSPELGTLLLLLNVFSIVGAALSSFIVANTVSAIMVEETRQIGIMMSLGGTRWTTIRTYLTFAGIIGFVGSVLGWALGLLGGRVLTRFLAGLAGLVLPPFSIGYRELLLAFLVGFLVTVGSTLFPAWVASGQPVARLLANRGVVADYGRGLTHQLTSAIARIGVSIAMGLRNVTRRPGRAAATLAVVAIAVAAFLSTQAVNRSVNVTVDHLYGLYGADGFVYTNQPMSLSFGNTLETDPSVTRAEPWANVSGSIGSTTTDVWGVPANTTMYHPQLVAGSWLGQANPIGIVPSENLASAIHASVGDILTLDVGTHSTLVQVVGIVNDASTFLGATTTGRLFMNTADLQRFLGQAGTTTLFALKLKSAQPANVDRELDTIEQDFKQYGAVTLAMYQDQESSHRVIDILTLMLDAMVIIVAVVGLAGIANTLLINLTERRREYGVLRSLGAGALQLVRSVLVEALGLTFIGCLAGTIIGYPLARFLVHLTGTKLFALQFHLGAGTILLAFVVALIGTAAVSTVPGLVATRIRPIQVLRYE
ncbi:MAG TPA: FtsX-like permease family protein, partial [Thermomicrobiaceae bacterium]|nr:FtsX-like permease family protein [Thermomicrobiaceae bacterium]